MKCSICQQTIETGQPFASAIGQDAIVHVACLGAKVKVKPTLAQETETVAQPPPIVQAGGKLVTPGGKALHKKTVSQAQTKTPGPDFMTSLQASLNKAKAPGPLPYWKDSAGKLTPKPKGPKTQKAKGIITLQKNGILSQSYAQVALTEADAVTKAQAIGLPCFARPCPKTPRHGFVDSREVKSDEDVRQVWKEARQADPEAELILMPFIKATHNMVWRPGLLSIGPGHDGATAGHESVTVFLQADYAKSWKKMAEEAGCDLEVSDPFLEAVSSKAHDTVVTQIRAGVKGAPTAPDWNPTPFVIQEVVTIDPQAKAVEGAMLAWERKAKKLISCHHVVYNPGGNLGDHWSVHAQLNGIAVATSFLPKVGDSLPKLGIDLVPLEPQAIIFGFLGGLVSPSLMDLTARKRAVCAALLGSHHGMRMGGDSGVFIGASVAMMLRLAQAALYGEARHKDHSGLSRDQVYKGILDDWRKGREGVQAKILLFSTASWSGDYGGPKWAACGEATADLDRAMLDLIKDPTVERANSLLGTLTTVVNLAHNNGWWLNKFSEHTWFDMAAALDPRVALMAGPIWYDAMLAPVDKRMALLDYLQDLAPIDLTKAGAGKVAKGKKATPKASTSVESEELIGAPASYSPKTTGKTGTFGVKLGETITLPFTPTKAQVSAESLPNVAHVQIGDGQQYHSGKLTEVSMLVASLIAAQPVTTSMGGTGTKYYQLAITTDGTTLFVGTPGADGVLLFSVTVTP